MTKKRWFLAVLFAGILLVGGAVIIEGQQTKPCAKNPTIGGPIDVHALPPVKNFDPCTNRFTMTDDALKHTGGPYITKEEAEKRATANVNPTIVQSYFVSFGEYKEMLKKDSEEYTIYPDREVWLVVVQAGDQGWIPSLRYGVTPWPRRWYYYVFDATTGQVLVYGFNGPKDGDWPSSLPLPSPIPTPTRQPYPRP